MSIETLVALFLILTAGTSTPALKAKGTTFIAPVTPIRMEVPTSTPVQNPAPKQDTKGSIRISA